MQVGKGRAGEYQENFIFPNQTYEYRLYPADNSGVPLAAVTVVGTQKVNYYPDFHIFQICILNNDDLALSQREGGFKGSYFTEIFFLPYINYSRIAVS